MVVILDYDCGNLQSLRNAFYRIQAEVVVSRDFSILRNASHIVLPGVGSFGAAMTKLRDFQLDKYLVELIEEGKIPVLGICLGMQLLAKYSEEGEATGLGVVDARVTKFEPTDNSLKVPHVGWSTCQFNDDPLFSGVNQSDRFYFTHSYHYSNGDSHSNIIAYSDYGGRFPAVLKYKRTYGAQFHPEKSHNTGLVLLKNFLTLYN